MILIHCDGAIKGGNPGGWGVGGYVVKVIDKETVKIEKGTIDLGKAPYMTNNMAEYAAVLAALFRVKRMNLTDKPIVVKSDSMLVVQHLSGRWNCNVPHLQALKAEIMEIVKSFKQIEFQWVPREQNTEADEVSKSLY